MKHFVMTNDNKYKLTLSLNICHDIVINTYMHFVMTILQTLNSKLGCPNVSKI